MRPIARIEEAAPAWPLDPSVVFLNHGSFGACPRAVLDEQARWRDEMEREPVEFLERRIDETLAIARERAAAFIGADPGCFAFVPNATTGVNTALARLGLKDGDHVIITDHAYPAVLNTVGRACDAAGAHLVIFPIPLPLPSPDEIMESLVARLGPRSRMVVIEHVASPTAAIFPVERIVSECRARGILTIVDAAHAPGMLPLDLRALGADVWTGNFHKWVCAPKGSAALVVSEEHRASMRPLITSQPWLESFTQTFAWTGTHDPTAYLSTPAAIDFLGSFGWEQVRARNHQLTTDARAVVADAIGAERLVDDAATGWMSIVPLPPGVATTREEARVLQAALYDGHRIEVPIVAWNGRGLVRLSAHLYNRIEHYHALAEALRRLL